MRKFSATATPISTRQQLLDAARRRHPAGGFIDFKSTSPAGTALRDPKSRSGHPATRPHPAGKGRIPDATPCAVCGGRGWVRAVVELALEIACPACGVAR